MTIHKDNVYFNAEIITTKNQPIIYQYNQNYDILKDTQNYKLLVSTFKISTNLLPIMVWDTQKEYKITLRSHLVGSEFSINLNYIPYTNVPISSPFYYYIYSIDHFLLLLNTALRNGLTALIALDGTVVNTEAPIFYRDNNNINILVQYSYDDRPYDPLHVITNYAEIYFNIHLYDLFKAYNGDLNHNETNKYFLFKFNWDQVSNRCDQSLILDRSGNYLNITPIYANITDLNTFDTLIITSSIPIYTEITGSVINNNIENVELEQILTDFRASSSEVKINNITFFNANETRHLDIETNENIQVINFSIKYKDRYNNIYQLYGDGINKQYIKFKFLRQHEDI